MQKWQDEQKQSENIPIPTTQVPSTCKNTILMTNFFFLNTVIKNFIFKVSHESTKHQKEDL